MIRNRLILLLIIFFNFKITALPTEFNKPRVMFSDCKYSNYGVKLLKHPTTDCFSSDEIGILG